MNMTEYIGKRVIVKAPLGRDDRGRTNRKMVEVGGICDYIGPNNILGYPLIIVVNRCPIVLDNIDQVKI